MLPSTRFPSTRFAAQETRCSGSAAFLSICSHEINLLKYSLPDPLPEFVEGRRRFLEQSEKITKATKLVISKFTDLHQRSLRHASRTSNNAPFDTLRCSGSGASSIICSNEINLLKYSLPELVEGGSLIRTGR